MLLVIKDYIQTAIATADNPPVKHTNTMGMTWVCSFLGTNRAYICRSDKPPANEVTMKRARA